MSELLTNRFISHSQSLKAKVLSQARSRMSRAKGEAVPACLTEEAYARQWTAIKSDIVTVALDELAKWRRSNGDFIRETEAESFPMQKAYWGTVGVTPTDAQLGSLHWQGRNFWSAAFISYVMKTAGTGIFFNYNALHMVYVYAAKQNRVNQAVDNPFWLCDVATAVPEPGDMICRNRDGSDYTYATVQPQGSSHCDIITSIDRVNNRMTVLGGNKGIPGGNPNHGVTVNTNTIHLNADGTVNTTRHRDIFAILTLRTDKRSTC